MNKKLLFFVAFILATALGILFYGMAIKQNKERPITFESDDLFLEKSMNDKITEAELIVIGEVQSSLPSRWNGPNGNDPQNASMEEIVNANGLFTDSIISINKTLKGDIVDPVVRVRSFIGETSKVRWTDEYEPSFTRNQTYLLFLARDTGTTASVDPGYYVSVNEIMGVYKIDDKRAISKGDRWALEELITYIEKSLSQLPTP